MTRAKRLQHLTFSTNFADFDCSLTRYGLYDETMFLVSVRLNQMPNHGNDGVRARKTNTFTHITKHKSVMEAYQTYNDALNSMKKHTYLRDTITELQRINNQRVTIQESALS